MLSEGWPSTIHSAAYAPAPPAKTIPKIEKPARTNMSRTPGTQPIRQRPSGV